MPLIAVFNDTGFGDCLDHLTPTPSTTYFQEKMSQNTLINGRPVAIFGTLGNATCGHQTLAFEVSLDVQVEGKGVHRYSDIGLFPIGFYETQPIVNNPSVYAN